MILGGHRDDEDPGAAELVSALSRAQASPLASVLPDAETARVLASRLREAGSRLADLEAVLARPDFDEAAAERRAAELAARGATGAAATAQLRVRTLAQLRSPTPEASWSGSWSTAWRAWVICLPTRRAWRQRDRWMSGNISRPWPVLDRHGVRPGLR